MDQLDLQLDNSQFVKSAEVIVSALQELKGAFASFASTPTQKITAELQGLDTSIATTAGKIKSELTDMIKSAQTLRAQARKAGEDVGQGLADGVKSGGEAAVVTMRAQTQKVQAEFEKLADVAKRVNNLQFKPDYLARVKAQSVNIGPELKLDVFDTKAIEAQAKQSLDIVKRASQGLIAYRQTTAAQELAEMQKSANLTFRARNAFANAEEAQETARVALLKRASQGLIAYRQTTAAQELAEMQKSANLTFRARNAFANAEEAQETARVALLKRASQGLIAFREKTAAQELAEMQKSSNLTFRARQTAIRAEEMQEAERMAMVARAAKGIAALRAEIAVRESSEALRVMGRTASAQMTAALAAPSGNYSSLVAGANFGKEIDAQVGGQKKLAAASGEVSKALKLQALDANDLHSAYRGLASGFGAMWLTWGRVLPLLAGAAVSHGITQIVSMGAQMDHTMRTIQVLSVETSASVQGLNTQLMEMARSGPFGPLEVAEAMKTLSLAGLSASQVSASIKDVLNLAVAGTTSVQKAADVMTSVATAFGVTAEGYNYVGDVIAKTAAVSKASTDSIGESFKTASVLGKQFGVSLEDVGIGLAALSNLGIQGTAAGTALRNMYVDLGGRTEKVAKVLKAYNLDLRDQQGNMLDVVTIMQKLQGAMSDMTEKSSKVFLHDLFSERGSKAIVELMDKARKSARETGDSVMSELQKMKDEILDASGFVVVSAAKMALTPLNQMKSVAAGLQASLVEAFNGLEPVILNISDKLRTLFSSEDFRASLQNLMTLVGNLTVAFVSHIDVILKVAEAYAAFKILQVTGVMFEAMGTKALAAATSMQTMATASKVAAEAQIAGNVASAASVTATGLVASSMGKLAMGASAVAKMIPVVGQLVQVAAGAWMLYEMYVSKSAVATKDMSQSSYSRQLVEKLDAETARLRENTEAMQKNMTVQELRNRQQVSDLNGRMKDDATRAEASAQKELLAAKEKLAGFDNPNNPRRGVVAARAPMAAAVEQASAQLEKVKNDAEIAQKDVMYAQIRAETEARRNRQATLDKLKAERDEVSKMFGKNVYEGIGKTGSSSNPDFADASARLAIIQKKFKTLGDEMDNEAKEHSAFQKFQFDVGISNFEKYQAALTAIQETQFSSRKGLLGQEKSELEAQLARLEATAKADPKGNKGGKLTNEIDKVKEALRAADASLEKLNNQNTDRLRATFVESAKGAIALNKATELTVAQIKEETALEVSKLDIKNDVVSMTEKEAEVHGKVLDATKKINKEVLDRQVMLKQLTQSGVFKDMDDATERGRAAKAVYDRLIDSIKELQALSGQVSNDVGQAAATAFDDKKTKELAKDLKEKLAQAIMDAGKDGGQGLRDYLMQELLRKPFKIFLEGVLEPLTGSLAGVLTGNSKGSSGALGALSNLSSLSNIGTAIGGGITQTIANVLPASLSTALGMSSSTLIASNAALAGGASGSAAAAAAGAAGNATALGGFGTAMAAIPVWGWAALAAAAIIPMLMGNGDSRYGSAYQYSSAEDSRINGRAFVDGGVGYTTSGQLSSYNASGTRIVGGPNSGVNFGGASSLQETTIDGINKALEKLGSLSRVVGFGSGFESSQNGKGFSYAGGTLTNGQNFGTVGAGWMNNRGSMNTEEAQASFVQELKQSTLQALQAASDIPKSIRNALAGVDVNALTGKALDDLMAAVDVQITNLSNFKDSLELLPFAQLRDMSVSAVDALAQLTGGLESLGTKLASYYTNFYSAEEKRANVVRNITKVLNDAGAGLSETFVANASRETFRAMVESADTGSALYAALLNVNEAFAGITTEIESAASRVTAARANLVESYKAEVSAMQDTVKSFRTFATDLRNFRDNLRTGSLSPLTPGQRYAETSGKFDKLVQASQEGSKEDRAAAIGQLQGAASALLDASKLYNASGGAYISDFDRVQEALSGVSLSASATADVAQLQLDAAQAQLTALGEIDKSVLSVADAISALAAAQQAAGTASALPAFADGGRHAGGWALVGERGPELAYMPPAHIYTASESRSMLGGQDNTALVAELRALREEVSQLRQQQSQETGALIESQYAASARNANTIVTAQSKGNFVKAPSLA